jgi:hypothetical protein
MKVLLLNSPAVATAQPVAKARMEVKRCVCVEKSQTDKPPFTSRACPLIKTRRAEALEFKTTPEQ